MVLTISACIEQVYLTKFKILSNKLKRQGIKPKSLVKLFSEGVLAFTLDEVAEYKPERKVSVSIYISEEQHKQYSKKKNREKKYVSLSVILEDRMRKYLSGDSLPIDEQTIGIKNAHIATARLSISLYDSYKAKSQGRDPSISAIMRAGLDEYISTGTGREKYKRPPCVNRLFYVSPEVKKKYKHIRTKNNKITATTLMKDLLIKYLE